MTTTTCAHCQHTAAAAAVPSVYDNEGWALAANAHDIDCEWVATRGERVEPYEFAMYARVRDVTPSRCTVEAVARDIAELDDGSPDAVIFAVADARPVHTGERAYRTKRCIFGGE